MDVGSVSLKSALIHRAAYRFLFLMIPKFEWGFSSSSSGPLGPYQLPRFIPKPGLSDLSYHRSRNNNGHLSTIWSVINIGIGGHQPQPTKFAMHQLLYLRNVPPLGSSQSIPCGRDLTSLVPGRGKRSAQIITPLAVCSASRKIGCPAQSRPKRRQILSWLGGTARP
jgi:hypothetical protein